MRIGQTSKHFLAACLWVSPRTFKLAKRDSGDFGKREEDRKLGFAADFVDFGSVFVGK